MLARRIEQAALNAWPALQQILYDGWVLRFSQGYTKRANSVNPLYGSNLDLDEKIDVCARLYAAQGLPPTFRLTTLFAPPQLDAALARRGYQKIDPTLVLHLDLDTHCFQANPALELRRENLDDWLSIFCQLTGAALPKQRTHKKILQAIAFECFFASLVVSRQVAACGLLALEGDYVGLFDLLTAPQQRNKGYGAQLVSGLLAWAQCKNARHAYLQVVEANAPARRLYESKLGFRQIYAYWYRRKHEL